ncbi:MAG: HigA family addiction module antitoxin [Solirubrobacterales bacterium]
MTLSLLTAPETSSAIKSLGCVLKRWLITMVRGKRWRDWAVSPGEVLAEALAERGMSQSELARRTARPVKTINEIVQGKAAITPDTAIQLELSLGISAEVWNNLETSFRAHQAEQRVLAQLEQSVDWAETFPLRDLAQMGLIEKADAPASKVRELLGFFGVSSREAWERQWERPVAAFRASKAHTSELPAVSAWLRWGEILAAATDARPFDRDAFQALLPKLKRLTRQDPAQAMPQVQRLCAEVGVLVVLAPEFKGTRLSGAARRLPNRSALIQLSLRHKTDDHLWFSFFHEAAHLLAGSSSDQIDLDDPKDQPDSDEERVADSLARNILIDNSSYEQLVSIGDFSVETIREFAKSEGVSPGIVVGRLQREGKLPWSRLNTLKKRVNFDV